MADFLPGRGQKFFEREVLRSLFRFVKKKVLMPLLIKIKTTFLKVFFKIFLIFLDLKNKYLSNFKFKLDYKGKDIFIRVDSTLDYARSKACKKEPGTVLYLEENLQKGEIFYDIGANIGAYAILASKLNDVLVYAFEPSYSTFRKLVDNIILNGCENTVKPYMIALAAETKINTFHYHSLEAGAALHSIENNIDYRGNPFLATYRQEVLSFSIDDLVHHHGFKCPNHVKIDVDGAEMDILKGAVNVLKDARLKTIIVEVNIALDEKMRFVNDVLKSNNFEMKKKIQHGNSSIYDFIFVK